MCPLTPVHVKYWRTTVPHFLSITYSCPLCPRRHQKYTSCTDNHGIRPPPPEQYLTPLQQKEVCIRHLRARLKETVDRLQDRWDTDRIVIDSSEDWRQMWWRTEDSGGYCTIMGLEEVKSGSISEFFLWKFGLYSLFPTSSIALGNLFTQMF